jgi:hypothetical protein
MMRNGLFAALLVLSAAGCAATEKHRQGGASCPRLAAMAEPAYPYVPGYPSTRPVLPPAVRLAGEAAFTVMSFLPAPPLYIVGMAGPAVIRLGRIALFGAPFPNQPRENALWVISPWIIKARNIIRSQPKLPPMTYKEYMELPPTLLAPPAVDYHSSGAATARERGAPPAP